MPAVGFTLTLVLPNSKFDALNVVKIMKSNHNILKKETENVVPKMATIYLPIMDNINTQIDLNNVLKEVCKKIVIIHFMYYAY